MSFLTRKEKIIIYTQEQLKNLLNPVARVLVIPSLVTLLNIPMPPHATASGLPPDSIANMEELTVADICIQKYGEYIIYVLGVDSAEAATLRKQRIEVINECIRLVNGGSSYDDAIDMAAKMALGSTVLLFNHKLLFKI